MCLITTQGKPFKAEEDIKCWKVLLPGRKALYYDFIYPMGQTLETKISRIPLSSRDWCAADMIEVNLIENQYPNWNHGPKASGNENLTYYGRGFHVALTLSRAQELHWSETGQQIHNAVIPKGSIYYKGFSEIAVSNKIIVY